MQRWTRKTTEYKTILRFLRENKKFVAQAKKVAKTPFTNVKISLYWKKIPVVFKYVY
jgi:hypothetical protein